MSTFQDSRISCYFLLVRSLSFFSSPSHANPMQLTRRVRLFLSPSWRDPQHTPLTNLADFAILTRRASLRWFFRAIITVLPVHSGLLG